MAILQYFLNIPQAAWSTTVAAWIAVAAGYVLLRLRHRHLPHRPPPQSSVGLALQGAAFGVAFGVDRPPLSPLRGDEPAALAAWGAVTLVAGASVALIWAALFTLGANWSASDRLAARHRLVTGGPYSRVRHPLYLGMLGLLFATTVVGTSWPAAPGVALLYAAGTAVRIRQEDQALARAHPGEWPEYRARVPALVPKRRRDRPGRIA